MLRISIALRVHPCVWARFIATSQGLDTDESNPASKLFLHILGVVAPVRAELIRKRVSAGMKPAMAHGTKSGNAIGRRVGSSTAMKSCGFVKQAIDRENSHPDAHWCWDRGSGPSCCQRRQNTLSLCTQPSGGSTVDRRQYLRSW